MNQITEDNTGSAEAYPDRKKRTLPSGISMRKDGRYQGRFTAEGKRYTLYDRDLKLLIKRMADARYEAEHGLYGNLTGINLNTWFQIWLKEYKFNIVKQSTLLLYYNNYDRYIVHSIGTRKLSEIRTLHIQQLYNKMKFDNLSIGTIRIVHSLLYNLFNQAIINDLIVKNPCTGVIIPKDDKRAPRVLTADEQELFIGCIQGNYYRPLYLLALATGLRIGELAALTWDDINFDSDTLSVRRTLLYQKDIITGKFGFRFQTPKSHTSIRTVPLLPDIRRVLLEHRCNQHSVKAVNSLEFKDLVFTTRNGTPIQECYIIKRLEYITKKMNEHEARIAATSGLAPVVHDRITPHTLRHSFATRAFESGLAPKTVQEILGHSSLSLTMDLYTHVTDDVKLKEMNKMSHLFRSLS